MSLSPEVVEQLDVEIAKYPAEERQAALMAALTLVQREQGWISHQAMEDIAAYLKIPRIRVAEVATFYSMYELDPVGAHKISVCTNVSCMLRGCDKVVAHLREKLGIGLGETTADGKITLREVECLAACGGAPMMQVNDDYHENLTIERIDEILEDLENA